METLNFGIDIVDIDRINKLYHRYGDRFLNRCFSEKELAEAIQKNHFIASLAGKFAAKEAFIKTKPENTQELFSYEDIEILSDSSGKPWCFFKGSRLQNSVLSISHERRYAIAGLIRY